MEEHERIANFIAILLLFVIAISALQSFLPEKNKENKEDKDEEK